MDYLGIDISKRTSVIAHYFEDKFQKEFTIQNNKNGYNQLLKYLKKLNQPQLIFESTGVYSRGIVQFCQVNHVKYIEMNPLEAKFKTNSLRSWKTDHSDAHKLAQLGPTLKYTDSLNTKNEIYFELRERVRFHLEIEKNQSRLKVQIIELLHQTFPGLEKLFKNRYSMIALNIAEIYSHPSFVQQQDIDTLISNIFNSTEKGLSTRKAENYADKLSKIAHESYPSVKSSSFLVRKLQLLIRQLKDSIEQLSQLDKEMINLAQELKCYEIIQSIPGIGELTAAMLIGELGDITHFKTNKQLNAYVGIDIKRYQSGNTHYKDTINKRGNKKARQLLFWIVMNIIRGQRNYDNHVVDYYYKLRKQPNEKSHKTAVIACINRLLKTIHYLIMNQKLYDYQMSPH
ncbi:IS110 family transposase [Staphylococcus haemolyticus]|uniref:IS110 family transposase n=1 Tax=Staphylococcus haemolyticus TaxID=1283 RepID=UPI0009B271CA|nr:IS110 family transposase [Staphylococcus haemolyticus]MCH4328368.1 IS110 family transposase [Staphylococcus haemolyticus]MCH4416556.1 IS110 family transposase [Staphylococcus haemolyticus]MCH4458803.1 IS110 family transposase [Staphylococcus haemolyticus]MCH4491678.1 IS110 family transposase [Staphylococcus haemolyticus]MDU0436039.1 IS110 family transposase [Staphylococcus haemolyticus]